MIDQREDWLTNLGHSARFRRMLRDSLQARLFTGSAGNLPSRAACAIVDRVIDIALNEDPALALEAVWFLYEVTELGELGDVLETVN